MKKIITITLLFISHYSNAQFDGSWYTFRIEDISFTTITKDKLINGRIGNYNTNKEYIATVDTLNFKNRIIKNDSILYIITNPETDNWKKKQIIKYVYHKNSNTLSTFFFDNLKKFQELQANTENLEIKDIEKFISEDNSNISYLTYYRKETIDTFISYPKLIDQPTDTIIKLYENLSLIYLALQSKTEEEMFPYFLLKGMSKSVIQVPAYLELKINPSVSRENYDEILIREKFKNNKDVIDALKKYQSLM
nr:hypothetical protein [uncultured Flavobacterium sp.]